MDATTVIESIQCYNIKEIVAKENEMENGDNNMCE